MDPAVSPRVLPFPDLGSAARALAERMVGIARSALAERGRCAVGLSGGSTPLALFRAFATEYRASVAWERLDYFWADERAVPPDDPRSNFGLAERSWLGALPIPPAQVHRIRGESASPEDAAREYEAELRRTLRPGDGPRAPLLDVMLLGMGPDGHTASLFPGSRFLSDSGPWVGVEPHPALAPLVPRITLTRAAIDRSRFLGFLVAGEEKRAALLRALRAPPGGDAVPAGAVRGIDATEWFVDRAALGLSEGVSPSDRTH